MEGTKVFQIMQWNSTEEYYAFINERSRGLEQLALEDAEERGFKMGLEGKSDIPAKKERHRRIKELLTKGVADENICELLDVNQSELNIWKAVFC
jgi:DNA invertase Pin-like site-specific DNA recombinase